jgi:hypothetical protein
MKGYQERNEVAHELAAVGKHLMRDDKRVLDAGDMRISLISLCGAELGSKNHRFHCQSLPVVTWSFAVNQLLSIYFGIQTRDRIVAVKSSLGSSWRKMLEAFELEDEGNEEPLRDIVSSMNE